MSAIHLEPPASQSGVNPGALQSPVGRLPVEILSRTFCHLSSSAEPHEEDLHAPTPPWGPVLHVCRWWRQVALDTKDLWRIIPLGHVEWAKLALRLSHPNTISISFFSAREQDTELPLTLEQHSGPSGLHDIVIIALSEASRAHEIDLSLQLLDKESQLRLLVVLEDATPDELVKFGFRGYLRLNAFNSEPTKLRHLSLGNCLLYERPRVYVHGLITLRVTNCQLSPTYPLIVHIRDIQSLQLLESLCIHSTGEASDTLPMLDLPQVLLPRLKVFELIGDSRLMHAYLAHLGLPSTCTLKLFSCGPSRRYDQAPIQETIGSLIRILSLRIKSAVETFGMQVDIDIDESFGEQGRFIADVWNNAGQEGRTTRLLCSFEWALDPVLADPYDTLPLSPLVDMVPRETVISTLSIDKVLDVGDWTALRPLLSRVEQLSFCHCGCTANFLAALQRPLNEEMPVLRHIDISYVRYGALADKDDVSFSVVHDIVRSSLLCPGLEVEIESSQTSPTDEEVAILESYGENVQLDFPLARRPLSSAGSMIFD